MTCSTGVSPFGCLKPVLSRLTARLAVLPHRANAWCNFLGLCPRRRSSLRAPTLPAENEAAGRTVFLTIDGRAREGKTDRTLVSEPAVPHSRDPVYILCFHMLAV